MYPYLLEPKLVKIARNGIDNGVISSRSFINDERLGQYKLETSAYEGYVQFHLSFRNRPETYSARYETCMNHFYWITGVYAVDHISYIYGLQSAEEMIARVGGQRAAFTHTLGDVVNGKHTVAVAIMAHDVLVEWIGPLFE